MEILNELHEHWIKKQKKQMGNCFKDLINTKSKSFFSILGDYYKNNKSKEFHQIVQSIIFKHKK